MDDQRCHLDETQNGDNTEGAANTSLSEMIGQLIKFFFLHTNVHLGEKANHSKMSH